jgi:acyl-CoA synthetase (AMP-forming)/AMP-acid ligase II
VDDDTDATEGELSGEFDDVIRQGLEYDRLHGNVGWDGLCMDAEDEDDVIALAYTSGTTAKPKVRVPSLPPPCGVGQFYADDTGKGVEYTHRGCYLAAMANVIESGLQQTSVMPHSRAKYLTILPLFHAVGWTFPWAVVQARATHYCFRKIDYGEMWRLLKDEGLTHFNAAPTVNTLLCAHPAAEKLAQPVRVTVAASPPTAKLFSDMIALNLLPVHVYGLVDVPLNGRTGLFGRLTLVDRLKPTAPSPKATSCPNGTT